MGKITKLCFQFALVCGILFCAVWCYKGITLFEGSGKFLALIPLSLMSMMVGFLLLTSNNSD
jgi:hypothetical protein